MELHIVRLDKSVEMPGFSKEDDAAFDLRAAEEHVIRPGKQAVIKTGLKMAIPKGHAGLIWDRSGLAAKHSLHVLAGVIDSGYRGEVGVVLINLGSQEFRVEKNMRIAQMLVQPVARPEIFEADKLDETERNEGGFGHTGLR